MAVKEKHMEDFKAPFSKKLSTENIRPADAGDSLNRERAIIKVLLHEVAKLKSTATGIAIETVLQEFEKDVRSNMDELNSQE